MGAGQGRGVGRADSKGLYNINSMKVAKTLLEEEGSHKQMEKMSQGEETGATEDTFCQINSLS